VTLSSTLHSICWPCVESGRSLLKRRLSDGAFGSAGSGSLGGIRVPGTGRDLTQEKRDITRVGEGRVRSRSPPRGAAVTLRAHAACQVVQTLFGLARVVEKVTAAFADALHDVCGQSPRDDAEGIAHVSS